MVFIWVSTGVSEPYHPQAQLYPTVPKVRSIQDSKAISAELMDSETDRKSYTARNYVAKSYEANSNPTSPGDPIKYVDEIMTQNVETLHLDSSIEDARNFFTKKRFRHVPIVDRKNNLIGIISDRDILRLLADSVSLESKVAEFMKGKVLSAQSDTPIREAASVMFHQKIGCLPVLGTHHEIKGIITRSDILRTVINNPPLDLYA
ncbi:CBS domain-containing protein [Leptospira sp. GIMC2001]|uniref:CBS domain-containing protein n=1 Tax=Leptospira sp. GIMC2001 TaxID=1513297 RepID=UPI00234A05C0|nr:CBS domain-containing protein [Leptospira sp. GIMC2001]WCL50230.1 CBS domain-containing protein [Leptospira sp. GIMC2001]